MQPPDAMQLRYILAQFNDRGKSPKTAGEIRTQRMLAADCRSVHVMNPHTCTDDQRVERSAVGLFDALGWQTVSAGTG